MDICPLCRIPRNDDEMEDNGICETCNYELEQTSKRITPSKPVGAVVTCFPHRKRSCQVCFPGS